MKALSGSEWGDLIGSSSLDQNAPFLLSGSGSRKINESIQNSNDVDKFQQIVTFFRFRTGEEDFFDNLKYIKYQTSVNANNQILPIEELYSNRSSKATELETASGMAYLGSSLAKKDDRLKESAKTHLKLGNIKQYCEIMIKLGN